MSNGVGGPSAAESFVVDRIAKRLPGAYAYPSFVPLRLNNRPNPLDRLFQMQIHAHATVSKGQGLLKEYLSDSLTKFQCQLKNDSYWPVAKDVDLLIQDLTKYLTNPGGGLGDVSNDLSPANLAISKDPTLTGDPQKKVLAAISALQSAVGLGNPLAIKAMAVAFGNELLAARGATKYTAPSAVNTLVNDINTVVYPLSTTPSSGQIQIIQADIVNSESALNADSLPKVEIKDTIAFLECLRKSLSPALPIFDPMISLTQVIDSGVSNLNVTAGGSAASAPPASPTSAPAAGSSSPATSGSTPAAATPAPSTSPPQPSAGAASATLATNLLRGHDYDYMLQHGAKLLRVVVEGSEATDRMDSFGLNLPSRKSSAYAQLSFSIFDSTGQIDTTGTSLAYLPLAVANKPLEGNAQILRDEPPATVALKDPTISVEPIETASEYTVPVMILPLQGSAKAKQIQADSLYWSVVDETGQEVDTLSPGQRQVTDQVVGRRNRYVIVLPADHPGLQKGITYRVIIRSLKRVNDDSGNETDEREAIASGECTFHLPQ